MWTCRGKGQRGLKHSWVKFRNRSLTLFPRSKVECATSSSNQSMLHGMRISILPVVVNRITFLSVQPPARSMVCQPTRTPAM